MDMRRLIEFTVHSPKARLTGHREDWGWSLRGYTDSIEALRMLFQSGLAAVDEYESQTRRSEDPK